MEHHFWNSCLQVCGKGFKRKDHLREHKVIHSENKPYQCDTCLRKFNQHVCLRKHLPCRELERREKRSKSQSRPGKVEQRDIGTTTTLNQNACLDTVVGPDMVPATVKDLGLEHCGFQMTGSCDSHGPNTRSQYTESQPRTFEQGCVTNQIDPSVGKPLNDALVSNGNHSTLVHGDTEHPPIEILETTQLVSEAHTTHDSLLDSSSLELLFPFNTTATSVSPGLLFPATDGFSSDISSKGVCSDGLSGRPLSQDMSGRLSPVLLNNIDPDNLNVLMDQTTSLFASIQSWFYGIFVWKENIHFADCENIARR